MVALVGDVIEPLLQSRERLYKEDWYAPKFTIEAGGFIKVPTGPGLGISYDEAIWEEAELI